MAVFQQKVKDFSDYAKDDSGAPLPLRGGWLEWLNRYGPDSMGPYNPKREVEKLGGAGAGDTADF